MRATKSLTTCRTDPALLSFDPDENPATLSRLPISNELIRGTVRCVLIRTMHVLRHFSSVAKSPLAILRKKTGLPIAKCREALVLHADKLEDAEQWLLEQAQKEGWAKVEQLRGRDTRQGHIGVLLEEQKAALVEVRMQLNYQYIIYLSFIGKL